MTKFIPLTEGKTYNPEHLRPFDLELAKQGHPLAWFPTCAEVRFFAQSSSRAFDLSHYEKLHNTGWTNRIRGMSELKDCLRLAPLAIKGGKPLHVGDVIEVYYKGIGWIKDAANMKLSRIYYHEWRWPVEEVK